MSRLRSGPLAAWTSAWLAGRAASDEVIRATTAGDTPHQVGGLGAFDAELVPLSEALITWRKAGRPVRLALPVAGDVRGLPGPAEFRSAALEAGEAVHGGGLGIVPQVIEFAPSSAPPAVLWQAFETTDAPPDYLSVADAQNDLTAAIRESASALSAADVAGWIDDIAAELHDARRAGEHLNLPPGHPPRAVALVAQAERLQAVLDLAARDPTGGAIDRTGIAARAESLRPLGIAVRRARLSGYNALADGPES
ncbi:MAG: hypothetical protein QOK11_696 [Pseudonocardiales bacterium]|nr:hypothetical protein [Pseudonocardiales bacterium]